MTLRCPIPGLWSCHHAGPASCRVCPPRIKTARCRNSDVGRTRSGRGLCVALPRSAPRRAMQFQRLRIWPAQLSPCPRFVRYAGAKRAGAIRCTPCGAACVGRVNPASPVGATCPLSRVACPDGQMSDSQHSAGGPRRTFIECALSVTRLPTASRGGLVKSGGAAFSAFRRRLLPTWLPLGVGSKLRILG